MAEDFISNIFYFGAPKGGFKVYPDAGAAYNIFLGYYSSAGTDWILIAKKSGDTTSYTYIRYGLLTSVVDGRTGSLFGISINFNNRYFDDLKIFHTEIINRVWAGILNSPKILEMTENQKRIAFKSYDLFDESQFLDKMSETIKEVISEPRFSNYIKPSYDIPDADNNLLSDLSPDSSSSVIIERFKKFGIVKLSPNSQVETKTLAEKVEEHRQEQRNEYERLKNEVESLKKELAQKQTEILNIVREKNAEIDSLHKKLHKIRNLSISISNEVNFIESGEEIEESPESLQKESKQVQETSNGGGISDKEKKQSRMNSLKNPIIIGLATLVGIISFGSIIYFSAVSIFRNRDFVTITNNDTDKSNAAGNSNSQTRNQQQISSDSTDDPISYSTIGEKSQGTLKASLFLEKNTGKSISNENEFKEVLSSYLFGSSKEVKDLYNNNPDLLWEKIKILNRTDYPKIKTFLTNHSGGSIENNPQQQELLNNLLIFQK